MDIMTKSMELSNKALSKEDSNLDKLSLGNNWPEDNPLVDNPLVAEETPILIELNMEESMKNMVYQVIELD